MLDGIIDTSKLSEVDRAILDDYRKSDRFTQREEARDRVIQGIIEYCAIQRQGKSTLAVRDMVILLPNYSPDDVYANFPIYIDGVHCLENLELIEAVFKIFKDKLRRKIIIFDEVGQELKARQSWDKVQTEFVNNAWQMPKRGIVLLYCSNPGNSADIILRDATWKTVMPRYHKGDTWGEDYITADVIFNYELWIAHWTIEHIWPFQLLFDSWEPIESQLNKARG